MKPNISTYNPLVDNPKPFLFISYSHSDKKAVEYDLKKFSEMGVRFWYDAGISYINNNGNWQENVSDIIAMKECVGVVFYISKNSMNSLAVNEELKKTIVNNKKYFSINIGGSIQQIVKASEKLITDGFFDNFTTAFPTKKLYVLREDDPQNISHIQMVLEIINDWPVFEYRTSDFWTERKGEYLTITKYVGDSDIVIIPEQISGVKVSCISRNVFRLNNSIRFIKIPDSCCSIEPDSFEYCAELLSVEIGKGITTIPQRCFRMCKKLANISFQAEIIDECAFEWCTSLHIIEFPKLKIIKSAAFSFCKNLEKVVFDNHSDYIISSLAFYACENLCQIEFNSDFPPMIQSYAFPNGFSGVITANVKCKKCIERLLIWRQYIRYLVLKLSVPKEITYNEGTISWSSVFGANLYEIMINGYMIAETTETMFIPREPGYYKIRAIGNERIQSSEWTDRISVFFVYPELQSEIECQNIKSYDLHLSADIMQRIHTYNYQTLTQIRNPLFTIYCFPFAIYYDEEYKNYIVAFDDIQLYAQGATVSEALYVARSYFEDFYALSCSMFGCIQEKASVYPCEEKNAYIHKNELSIAYDMATFAILDGEIHSNNDDFALKQKSMEMGKKESIVEKINFERFKKLIVEY